MDVEREDIQRTDGVDVPPHARGSDAGRPIQASQVGQAQQTEAGDVDDSAPQAKGYTNPAAGPLSGRV